MSLSDREKLLAAIFEAVRSDEEAAWVALDARFAAIESRLEALEGRKEPQ